MKLIIDIPEDYYEIIKHHVDNHQLDYRPFEIIANGTPLDDVKAEIAKEENIWYHDCEPENGWKKYDVIRVDTVLEILDNIGKAESEET